MRCIASLVMSVSLSFWASVALGDLPAIDYAGVWGGDGIVSQAQGSRTDSIPSSFQVVIEPTFEDLRISECYLNEDLNGHYNCTSVLYLIRNETEIVDDQGQNVGSISPTQLIIYRGGAAASEQYVIRLQGVDKISYRYSAANLDGGGVFKQVALTRL